MSNNVEEAIQKAGSRILNERELIDAAANGNLLSVMVLIKSGVSVDAKEHNRILFGSSKNFKTPLQMACANGHAPCVEFLIAHGADVNAKDRFDVTATHMAAEKGHCSCLKALLKANAKCSLPAKYVRNDDPFFGATPLHLAAANNHIECVKELFRYGADYNAVDEFGRTSLYIAAQFGLSECVLAHLKNAVGRDILSLPSWDTQDTPLHFAVWKGMIDCVRALLYKGSDVNHINLTGFSPLHNAVNLTKENDPVSMDILRILVLNGYKTDVNLRGFARCAPLYFAFFNPHNDPRRKPEMAKFLLSYGADPNIKDRRGFSLLECELKTVSEDIEILKYIVRGMLQPPPLSKLRVPIPSDQNHPERELSQPADTIEFVINSDNISKEEWPMYILHYKRLWYENIASNPRTLQHICRFTIRKALGPYKIKYIPQFPIPVTMQQYLFLERGD